MNIPSLKTLNVIYISLNKIPHIKNNIFTSTKVTEISNLYSSFPNCP